MSSKRVIICGSRDWNNIDIITNWIRDNLSPGDILIHGGCRGADRIANNIAKAYGDDYFTIIQYNANWRRYGRGAGPIRNRQMLIDGNPDLVVGFTNDIENSKGTKNMIEQAHKHNIPTMIISDMNKIVTI